MKNILYIVGVLLLIASCSMAETVPSVKEDNVGQLTVNITLSEATKASVMDSENVMHDLQVFVFGQSDGKLYFHREYHLGVESCTLRNSITVKPGMYSVWVVANYPLITDVKTLSELKKKGVLLKHNTSSSFVMRGYDNNVNVTTEGGEANIEMERLVSRIFVRNITNNCSESIGELGVRAVFLANVVGNQNLAGTASPMNMYWYNKCGCVGGFEGREIDGTTYMPDVPDMTWRTINKTIQCGQTEYIGARVYGFQNTETTTSEEFPFTPRMSRLCFILVQKDPLTSELVEHHVYLDLSHLMLTNTTYSFDLVVDGNIGLKDVAITVTANLVSGYDTVEGGSFDI